MTVGKEQKYSSKDQLQEQSSGELERKKKQSSSLVGVKCQEGKNDQWHQKLEEGKRKKVWGWRTGRLYMSRSRRSRLSHMGRPFGRWQWQQDGQRYWQGHNPTEARQGKLNWARQAELVRLWLSLSLNSPAHKASPKQWDIIWGGVRIRVRIRAGDSSQIQWTVQGLSGRTVMTGRPKAMAGKRLSGARSVRPRPGKGKPTTEPGQALGTHRSHPGEKGEAPLTTDSGTALLSFLPSCIISEPALSTGSSAPGR